MSRERSGSGAFLALFVVFALVGLGVWAFLESRGEAAREIGQEHGAGVPQRIRVADGKAVIMLAPAAQKEDGIKTLALRNAPHRERLRAYGTVLDLGPLTKLANSYAAAKAQLAIAKANLAAARLAFARARTLYNDRQNISAAHLQEAAATFHVDEARFAAAQSDLATLAATAEQDWGQVLGEAVAGDKALLRRLIAGRDVLLQVTLRPEEVVALPPRSAFTRSGSGARAPLRFVSAATKTDPRFQGASFYFTAPAASGLLPGMSVVASLPSGPAVLGAVVPASAIVWQGRRAWAYFRIGSKSFARRAIATDLPARTGGYIVRGIANDAEVVVAGAQMLLSEELRGQMNTGDED